MFKQDKCTSQAVPLSTLTILLQIQVQLSNDAASGLLSLEKLDIVHCDVSSRNCLVSTDQDGQSRLRVADLGRAKDLKGREAVRGEFTEFLFFVYCNGSYFIILHPGGEGSICAHIQELNVFC